MSKTNNDDIKIKYCPFGHEDAEAEPILALNQVGDKVAVFCGVCGASGPAGKDAEEAVSKWNTQQLIVVSKELYEKLTEEQDGEEEESTEPKVD